MKLGSDTNTVHQSKIVRAKFSFRQRRNVHDWVWVCICLPAYVACLRREAGLSQSGFVLTTPGRCLVLLQCLVLLWGACPHKTSNGPSPSERVPAHPRGSKMPDPPRCTLPTKIKMKRSQFTLRLLTRVCVGDPIARVSCTERQQRAGQQAASARPAVPSSAGPTETSRTKPHSCVCVPRSLGVQCRRCGEVRRTEARKAADFLLFLMRRSFPTPSQHKSDRLVRPCSLSPFTATQISVQPMPNEREILEECRAVPHSVGSGVGIPFGGRERPGGGEKKGRQAASRGPRHSSANYQPAEKRRGQVGAD